MNSNADSGTDFVAIWWERVLAGEKIVQACGGCGSLQMHPRRRCNSCASEDLSFKRVSGAASLYSFSQILRNAPSDFQAQLPYILAIIRLEEGPQMLTRIVNSDAEALVCDMRVQWTLSEIGGRMQPCFEPATA